MRNLEYYIGETWKETILRNVPYGVCAAKKKLLKSTTHTVGYFRILKTK